MNSEYFSFEIELNSSLKEGIIQNKSINLNISQPSSIKNAYCTFNNRNLNSSIILNCTISNLSQENRITNGINIEGIINNGFSNGFLFTDDQWIKLTNFEGNIFPNIECPKKYEIKHCKILDIAQKKCKQCYKNYYSNDSETQCLTCSQKNEGCNTCFNNGTCQKCINGFELKNNTCSKNKECKIGEYGKECKKCNELNLNCDECNKSGYCIKCKKGYYLSGIDSNSKCLKCLSTCEECESLNICTKCTEGLILNKDSCVSCLSLNEGCEECSQINNKCTKCYNNKMFKYELSNHKCIKKNENNNNKNKTNLQFERFDSYEKEDNKINFKPHFILLDNFLYNSTLYLTIIIRVIIINEYKDNRFLRYLQNSNEIEKNITCSQYGDSLGNNNKGGYLANFKCTIDLEEDEEIESMEPTKMEIRDHENSTIQSFESENKVVNINELETTSLDEEYQNIIFNKISINDISDIKLEDKDNLSFNIIGNLDSKIDNKIEYEISLKDNNNKMINATCTFENNDLVNQNISCNSLIDKDSKELMIINGVYPSKINNDNKLILNNNINDKKIVIPENKNKNSSIEKIIGIAVAAFVIVSLALFLIIKLGCNKNESSEPIKQYQSNRKGGRNTDNSKDIIVY